MDRSHSLYYPRLRQARKVAGGVRTMLDLFSGLGGASAAMKDRGWRVIRVDLDPIFAPDIVADIRSFHCHGVFDLLWASPPCDEFSRESMPWCRTGQPPDMSCVDAVSRLVKEIRPRYWVLENVKGAQKWLGKATAHFGPFYLWGEFPPFQAKSIYFKERLSSRAKAERAKIPYDLSLGLTLAIEIWK